MCCKIKGSEGSDVVSTGLRAGAAGVAGCLACRAGEELAQALRLQLAGLGLGLGKMGMQRLVSPTEH